MPSSVSVFLDFSLPNATTWFYFSLLLAVALFFKFTRILCVRNLDVVMMFALVPGLLLVQASRLQPGPIGQHPAVHVASLIGQGALADSPAATSAQVAVFWQQAGQAIENARWLWFGYLWLMLGSLYFFCRCLFDLTLAQRPALTPNLQTSGLAWLAGALLTCLVAVAYRQVAQHNQPLTTIAQAPSAATPLLFVENENVFAIVVLWRNLPAWAIAGLALTAHLSVVVMLLTIAWRQFQDLASGMAAATFYLILPYTGAYIGQLHHVLPMTIFLGLILAYRSPTAAGAILGLATAATYFPVFVLPIWLSFYRGKGSGRFLAAFLIVLATCLGGLWVILRSQGVLDESIERAWGSATWQPWILPPAASEGFWIGALGPYRIPVFLIFLSLVAGTMFWPTPKNLAHGIALSAAVFIALQWWGADQGGVYVLWYMPLMLLLVFRPNLQDRTALPIDPETDWLTRSKKWCVQLARGIIRRPSKPETIDVSKNEP